MRAFEILGIVLFRFPMLPRIWATFLILMNAASLLLIDTIYGQVALLAVVAAVAVMVAIHARLGFVRLLGIGHIFWIPMLVWFAMHLPDPIERPWLHRWVIGLIACNSISLVIDAIDVMRYVHGERKPHYTWEVPQAD